MTFIIRNEESLDGLDTKMPPELVKAMYDLKIQSVLDIGCGRGWLCDYLPPNTRYLGIDQNITAIDIAKKLHPEGRFVCSKIEDFLLHGNTDEKFECAFVKCMFCTVTKDTARFIVALIERCVTKYIFLYDSEKEPMIWTQPFSVLGYQLKFNHIRETYSLRDPLHRVEIPATATRSFVQVWSMVG
jgi:SAM-dependent methyltransferase